jgi:hypothetical protein
MNKLVLLLSVASLVACSSTDTGMKFDKKTPRAISISNVKKADRVKAYRAAEKHCAKYSKVPRLLRKVKQETNDYSPIPMRTEHYECIRPSNY